MPHGPELCSVPTARLDARPDEGGTALPSGVALGAVRRGGVGALTVMLVACGSSSGSEGPAAGSATSSGSAAAATTRVPGSHRGESTTARGDYIGPEACGECHPGEHAKWKTSLHRVMNAKVEDAGAVIGRFDGTTVAYAGGTATFAREGAAYTMTLAKDGVATRYRVTRTIGRKALQEYVGVTGDGVEVRLPFAWWPRLEGWYPQPYFDPWLAESAFDAYAPNTEAWAERCPWCHSTYPFDQRIARAQATGIGHGLEQLVATDDVPGTRTTTRLAVADQVSVGISCESCHLGGRAHAAGAPMHFDPRRAVTTTFAEERADATIVNRVCAGCHSGPSPHFANGAATRNSSEGLDLAASACTTARCTDCHDPHTGGADEAVAIRACVTCHDVFADPVVARTHAEHDTVTCLDCHMPRITMGVDRIVRTHRISSPDDRAMFAQGAPNACSLCHLDKSLRWVAGELERRYQVNVNVRGDEPLGKAYLASPEPAIRIVAADAFARTGAWERLLPGLADELAHVRTFTVFALERAWGRRISTSEYDARLPVADRTRQVSKLGRQKPARTPASR